MEIPLKIITTEDGSHSLFREDLNETYHSSHGAIGESTHVFINTGLDYLFFEERKRDLKVFEVGLGTGLNAFLSGLFAAKYNTQIDFQSVEPFPVGESIYSHLNYGFDEDSKQLLADIHKSPWNQTVQINPLMSLTKYESTLEDVDAPENYFDIIFFDAFAPSKQPEVWSLDNMMKCCKILKTGGLLNTYCAQGQFKRNLKAAGFEVESLQGAMGKREMIRARKK